MHFIWVDKTFSGGSENNLLIAQGKAKVEDEHEDETGNLIRFYNSSFFPPYFVLGLMKSKKENDK